MPIEISTLLKFILLNLKSLNVVLKLCLFKSVNITTGTKNIKPI